MRLLKFIQVGPRLAMRRPYMSSSFLSDLCSVGAGIYVAGGALTSPLWIDCSVKIAQKYVTPIPGEEGSDPVTPDLNYRIVYPLSVVAMTAGLTAIWPCMIVWGVYDYCMKRRLCSWPAKRSAE